MNEQLKDDDATPQPTESDVLVLIKKMQQQLVFLEKKIDLLINRPQEKSFQPFSPPHRPAGYNSVPRERSFDRGRPFEKREGSESREFGGPKKDYGGNREYGSNQGRHFKKKFGGPKKGFDPKKKFFFNKRRDQ